MWVKSFLIDIIVNLIDDLSTHYRLRKQQQPYIMDEEWASAWAYVAQTNIGK